MGGEGGVLAVLRGPRPAGRPPRPPPGRGGGTRPAAARGGAPGRRCAVHRRRPGAGGGGGMQRFERVDRSELPGLFDSQGDGSQAAREASAAPAPRRTAAGGRRGESNGNGGLGQLEQRLWNAADELRANSKLKSSEYSV